MTKINWIKRTEETIELAQRALILTGTLFLNEDDIGTIRNGINDLKIIIDRQKREIEQLKQKIETNKSLEKASIG